MSGKGSRETILAEQCGRVGLLTLSCPKALDALNAPMMAEVVEAFGREPGLGQIVFAGGEKAFATGADIEDATFPDWSGRFAR